LKNGIISRVPQKAPDQENGITIAGFAMAKVIGLKKGMAIQTIIQDYRSINTERGEGRKESHAYLASHKDGKMGNIFAMETSTLGPKTEIN